MVKKQTIAAGDFKARCLALLDEVAATGRSIVVTKRGKPVAQLIAIEPTEKTSLLGSVIIKGDIVSPVDSDWEVER